LIWPTDRLTKFEVARLIGARSLQISLGAPILIKEKKVLGSIEIARREFKNKIIPITVKRKLPFGEESVIDVKKGIKNWLKDHEGGI